MRDLMEDIINTAENFAKNFADKGNFDEPDYYVAIKAWDKTQKYNENGDSENILFYIDGFKEHIDKGMNNKGHRATII